MRRWELLDWLLFTRSGRVFWWAAASAVIFALTVGFQHMGWLS